ncbi:DUF4920 domain-containing protein [Flavobacterium amnicola]|uniref:DUF4920 domain-containing protein n=1 Tax=Flavobacterium amnicola TaxID=2506422 RepID=A0A4Q1K3K9_9FLAO|nr:DUF4920 domain-containing protein [Flavobacterium amnicola]RXR19317.1 DUF4920 domain-containing protein [Flavobacterium amnicola]
MKKISLLLLVLLAVSTGMNAQNNKKSSLIQLNDYTLFGEKFAVNNLQTPKKMLSKYKNLKKGDTINVQFIANIKDVCKKKGCWMNLELANNENSFVKFKDYSFFVPLNADGSSAIVNGKAFVDIVSVEELKHYAKDGKKSQKEIDAIKKPKVTYAFVADGVLIKKS